MPRNIEVSKEQLYKYAVILQKTVGGPHFSNSYRCFSYNTFSSHNAWNERRNSLCAMIKPHFVIPSTVWSIHSNETVIQHSEARMAAVISKIFVILITEPMCSNGVTDEVINVEPLTRGWFSSCYSSLNYPDSYFHSLTIKLPQMRWEKVYIQQFIAILQFKVNKNIQILIACEFIVRNWLHNPKHL